MVNIQTNRRMKLDGNARLIMEAIISVWLCQPIASPRNKELELPSLIVDNTRHVTQRSAIKLKIQVLPAKIELFQKPRFWAVLQDLYL